MASQSGAHGFPGKPPPDFRGASTFEPRLGAVGGASAMAVLQAARHDMSQRFRQVWLIRCVNGQFGTCSSQCSHLTNLNYTSLVLRVNSPSTRWPYCRCFFFLCHCWLAICGCTPSGSVWRKYQNTLNYPRFQWILIRFSSVFPIRSAILG